MLARGAPVKAVGLYAADPLVLAAGGTSLDADWVTDAYISETTWNEPGRPSSPARPRGRPTRGRISPEFVLVMSAQPGGAK